MVWTILREWLSGEKTLPEATRDWLTNRTGFEVGLMLLVLLVQSYVIALLRRALFAILQEASGYLQTASLRTVVALVFPVVLSIQLLYLMLEVRRISRAVAGPSTERRPGFRNVITEEDERQNDEPTATSEEPDEPV